jgi:histidinol dehydrogenase
LTYRIGRIFALELVVTNMPEARRVVSDRASSKEPIMQLPSCFPNPQRNGKAIETLLERVRNLDDDAQKRLATMLDDEMDLPYLDVMEREYAMAFQKIAPDHATQLRGRFVQALNEQRTFLVSLVRNVLQENLGKTLHEAPTNDEEMQF